MIDRSTGCPTRQRTAAEWRPLLNQCRSRIPMQNGFIPPSQAQLITGSNGESEIGRQPSEIAWSAWTLRGCSDLSLRHDDSVVGSRPKHCPGGRGRSAIHMEDPAARTYRQRPGVRVPDDVWVCRRATQKARSRSGLTASKSVVRQNIRDARQVSNRAVASQPPSGNLSSGSVSVCQSACRDVPSRMQA